MISGAVNLARRILDRALRAIRCGRGLFGRDFGAVRRKLRLLRALLGVLGPRTGLVGLLLRIRARISREQGRTGDDGGPGRSSFAKRHGAQAFGAKASITRGSGSDSLSERSGRMHT